MSTRPNAQIAINHLRRAQEALQTAQQYGAPWMTSVHAHCLTALCGAEGFLAQIITQLLVTAGGVPAPQEDAHDLR